MARPNRQDRWRPECWPEPDRSAWVAATFPGDDFTAPGRAATWTPRSRSHVELSYGRFLECLKRHGVLQTARRVGERVDLDLLRTFGSELNTEVASCTVWGIMQAVARAISAMDPSADLTVLYKLLGRLKRRARSVRRVEDRLLTPIELLAAARDMMDEAECRTLGVKAAVLFRNGAIIMGEALCPLRLRNWANLDMVRHLRLFDDRIWIVLESKELKTRHAPPIEVELDPEYVKWLRIYLNKYRPLLLHESSDSHALWLSRDGSPLRPKSMAASVRDALLKRCRRNFNFHLFRTAAATFIEDVAPDRAMMAAGVLHHSDLRMTRKHYVRGQRKAAHVAYHALVRRAMRRRRRSATPPRKPFGSSKRDLRT